VIERQSQESEKCWVFVRRDGLCVVGMGPVVPKSEYFYFRFLGSRE
jgi:hypothetical protein